MDADFVLVLPFHHGDLEPDCVGVSTRGEEGLMRGIEIPLQEFGLKNAGGAYARRGRICGTLRYMCCASFHM